MALYKVLVSVCHSQLLLFMALYKVLVSVHVCHTGSQLLLFMALYKVLVSVCHCQLLLFMALYKVLALTCAWSKSDRQPTVLLCLQKGRPRYCWQNRICHWKKI
jgi:hypothetical protein